MRNTGLDRKVARRVTAALEQAGLSVNRLALLTGIPQATLYRKLIAVRYSLTIEELDAIGTVLGQEVSSFIPTTNENDDDDDEEIAA